MRMCENPSCQKWFRPRKPTMRFCCPECCHSMRRKRPPRQTVCKQCFRHSRYFIDGLCSVCKQKETKFQREQKEQAKNPTRKKIKFRCERCKSKVSKTVWELQNGLCFECYKKRIGVMQNI